MQDAMTWIAHPQHSRTHPTWISVHSYTVALLSHPLWYSSGEFISYKPQELSSLQHTGIKSSFFFFFFWQTAFQLRIRGQDFSCTITTVLFTLICMNTGGRCRLFEHSHPIKEEHLRQTTCPYFQILKNWTYTQFACKVTLH